MKRETLVYEQLSSGRVRCGICQRRCTISEGGAGWCRTRRNEGGRLYSLIYGKSSSISVNPIEKKPVFHFHPGSRWLSLGSLGCNFRCPGCQNWEIAHWQGKHPSGARYLDPEDQVQAAIRSECRGLSWTFNEPTLWFEYTLDTAKAAKERGLFTNYVTNGYITPEAFELLAPFLDVYRVDIKGFEPETYRRVANVQEVQGIFRVTERAKRCGMHVEIVTNVIPGYNDDEAELRAIAAWIRQRLGQDTPWHVTRFYPHASLSHIGPTPIEILERARQIGRDAGLWHVYLGNVPGHEGEHTYCHGCGDLLIERFGFRVPRNRVANGRCPRCTCRVPGVF